MIFHAVFQIRKLENYLANAERGFCIYGDECLRIHHYVVHVNLVWYLDEKWAYVKQFHSAQRCNLRPK